MRWPGAIYDGEAARKTYTGKIRESAKGLGCQLDLRGEPIHNPEEASRWCAAAKDEKVDGLLVVLLDRQEHAWPTAYAAIDTGIPTVVFSPLGSSFTTNTAQLARKPGCFVCATDDFNQVHYGMKMLHARTKLRATRCVVLRGSKRRDAEVPDLGIQLRYVPAQEFLDEYNKTPVDDAIRAMASDLIKGARRQIGATDQDVVNGIKSYIVAGKFLQREEADAISMDCLGALGKSKVSLPCIAWSKMNDDGIPAACEADVGAIATHCVVQYVLDRPGFQQDPVPETAREAVIGAHCSCPTKLHGFDKPPEPYDILHHHGVRDATARPLWKLGEPVTCVDVELGNDARSTRMLISAGEVLENMSVPPAGGCVISVMVKFDNVSEVLDFPGFHQLFLYGDFKRELVSFCRLIKIDPVVV
jgi:hypothetical protein